MAIDLLNSGLGIWARRAFRGMLLIGQAIFYILTGRVDRAVTLDQMVFVGPESLPIALLTSGCIGMIFTIQVAREFLALGAGSTVGGILGIAMARELAPVIAAVAVAGRVGSAYAAEIGTMRVTEQVDALYTLKTDPVVYLVVPRLLACSLMLPLLTVLALVVGLGGGMFLADALYDITQPIFMNSVKQFLTPWDLVSGPIKGAVFGGIIAIIGCNWGLTTRGGAKGVGQSTTASVVTAIFAIFIVDFILSWLMFGGTGSAGLQGLG